MMNEEKQKALEAALGQIEKHYGWHIPERQFVVQPEVPVDGYVADKVDKRP